MNSFFLFQKIKNPNYKGKWKAPMIDNPGILLPLIIICVLLILKHTIVAHVDDFSFCFWHDYRIQG